MTSAFTPDALSDPDVQDMIAASKVIVERLRAVRAGAEVEFGDAEAVVNFEPDAVKLTLSVSWRLRNPA